MWQLITNCGKQLNINYIIRQTIDDNGIFIMEYKIAGIEIDEYKLELMAKSKNGESLPVDQRDSFLLTSGQIIAHGFEVWVENAR